LLAPAAQIVSPTLTVLRVDGFTDLGAVFEIEPVAEHPPSSRLMTDLGAAVLSVGRFQALCYE